MLKNIYVKNFVLIDELHLDFHSSFSCFTGETGAGKSLFIDALSILCGARASSSSIQKGAEKAFIEATFTLPANHPSLLLLEEAGHEVEDGCIIVSREFAQDGKSSARINHRSVTISLIKNVLSGIVDIHSQHDSQYLLNNKRHLGLLDCFIHDQNLLEDVQSLYKTYKKLKDELKYNLSEELSDDDLEYYQFQLQEIERLDVKPDEIDHLELRQKEMASFEKVSTSINNTIELLSSSSYESLYSVEKELESIQQEVVVKAKEDILNAYYMIDEQFHNLKDYVNSLEYDEQEFNSIQERLFEIHKLIRKHGNIWDDVEKKQLEIEEKIARIKNREIYIQEQEAKINEAFQLFSDKAQTLSLLRKKEALILEQSIQNELKDLQLENAQFKVQFHEDLNANGIDQVEFLISMNKGEELRPLAKVISGGELSRLMLGLKAIFNKLQNIQTIIFDEIDTGVSGSVAFAIGKKMKKIADDAQVFSITHLAPVAAWGDYQYLVEKQEINNHTVSRIRMLSQEERIVELASISSNSTSEQALIAAKELYDSCH